MISLQTFHQMKWVDQNNNPSEQVKIYGIFAIIIEMLNKQELYIQQLDRETAEIRDRLDKLEGKKK